MTPEATREELLTALTTFDQTYRDTPEWANWEQRGNQKFAMVENGKRYPVKEIIHLATGIPKNDFNGGVEANSYVTTRYFTVIRLGYLNTILTNFRRVYPDWTGFTDAKFVVEEIDYKQAVVKKAREQLAEHDLRQLLDQDQCDDLIKRIETVGRGNNLLYNSQPISGDLSILYVPDLDKPAFCDAFIDLLYSPADTETRLATYFEFVQAHNLPNKWTFPTYFLFFCYPEQEYFIKPTVTQGFLKVVERADLYQSQPNAKTYIHIRSFVHQLREDLKEFQPRDMIDIQSLIWVSAKAAQQAANYWKIAPGRNGWQWPECKEQEFIGVGWDELGDIGPLSHKDFATRRDELVKVHAGWTKNQLNQVWKFAQIQEGDQIVANQGTQKVLGIGTVTGPYYFVPGVQNGHRLPVEWYDQTPREIQEGSWVRTLVPLQLDKFNEIVDSPLVTPISDLVAPFSDIFKDRAEAEWAFDFLAETVERLGGQAVDDARFALTLPKGRHLLRLNLGNWMSLGFEKLQGELIISMNMLVSHRQHVDSYTHHWSSFATDDQAPETAIHEFPVSAIQSMSSALKTAYQETYRYVAQRFSHWQGTPFNRSHQPEIFAAVFDTDKRATLLSQGLATKSDHLLREDKASYQGGQPNTYFTETTFELLSDLHATPYKTYYQDNRERFRDYLEAPFQRLLKTVAARLPETMTAVLETEKHLFGRILKNDYGQGGAWSHYWGAFYPKESKRTEDAQLSIWINREWLEFGFYIGEYGDAIRERFSRHCQIHQQSLRYLMGDILSDERFYFGRQANFTIDEDGKVVSAISLNWQEWLQDPSRGDFDVSFIIPRDRLFDYSNEQLETTILQTYQNLFPLILLAILDNPLPAIKQHLAVEDDFIALEKQPEYSLETCAADSGLELAVLERWVRAITRKKQAIFYGPPGTGKTYIAQKLAQHLVGEGAQDGFVEIVQFHPAYAYEDFIEGIRPQTKSGALTYDKVAGRFLQFCEQARTRQGLCVLIVDEINRANLARVFGELMYLLEYRTQKITLASGLPFQIPDNVRLIGTMNTADRSIALVDHALRRRFAFLALRPSYETLRHFHRAKDSMQLIERLIDLLQKLNNRIGDQHYEVGITFFLVDTLEADLADIWQMEIEPYLEEYFFDQPEKVAEFQWATIADILLVNR